MSYTAVHLAERPIDDIIPGKTFTEKPHPLPSPSSLKPGEVILQVLYLSLDPAMRPWLKDVRSYIPPVEIGAIMRGYGIGIVRESRSDKFKVGTYASGMCGWAEYAVMHEKNLETLDLPEGAVPTDALGVMGLTGMTAYFGILDVGRVKKGDVVVVSGAAGATGSVVAQISKIMGARVIGIAGSDDKCRWLKEELGLDEALNYKDPEYVSKFKAATKGFIDVYFDNVGGEILELALSRAKPHARFVMCGAISQYNKNEPSGLKNYGMIISMRIRMQGFIVTDYVDQYPEARKQMGQWLAEGKLKRKETVVKGGIGKAQQALVDLYNGVNTGKLLVEVAKPEDARANL